MKIDLKNYLANRDRFDSAKRVPGPVITISREYGCGATIITRKLVQVLSSTQNSWRYISKEILYDSARELNLSPGDIENVLHPQDRTFLEDLFSSLNTNYQVDEHKIDQTIRGVITDYAIQGNIVIVGQGGIAITKNIKKSLHIKIIAPLEWRAEQLSRKMNISFNNARKKAEEHDHRRALCIDHFMGRTTDYTIFDILFNASTLSSNEIVNEILNFAEMRNLIEIKN